MCHSLTRGISGLEGSSDGLLLLLQEMVLVLRLWGQIEEIWPIASVHEKQWLSLHTSLPVVLDFFLFFIFFVIDIICC